MIGKTAFIIFAHSELQNVSDIDDLLNNIQHFSNNSDFFINHPTIIHEKIFTNHVPGVLNHSNFIFGGLIEIINKLDVNVIDKFDHFCLVSANQYFINQIKFEVGVNYVQFLNTNNWDNTYHGKNTTKTIVGFPLNQPYGRWDPKDLYKEFNIDLPMSANWECMSVTKEVMKLAKKNIHKCIEYYPNLDMMNIFLPYMVLLSKQRWEFPPHFGTYDPSNNEKNFIITNKQVIDKFNDGYFSVKRVNYNKNCSVKSFIRKNLY